MAEKMEKWRGGVLMKKLFWGMCICMMAVIGIMPLTAEAKVNIEEVDEIGRASWRERV